VNEGFVLSAVVGRFVVDLQDVFQVIALGDVTTRLGKYRTIA
jgi:hypothetical protein